jgi:hypothetical protein
MMAKPCYNFPARDTRQTPLGVFGIYEDRCILKTLQGGLAAPMGHISNTEQRWQKMLGIICAVALFLAIPAIWPYSYFQLLRWLVCLSAAYIGFLGFQTNRATQGVAMVIVAVVFNPIAPIYLAKSTWIIFDFVAALIFLYFAFAKKHHE